MNAPRSSPTPAPSPPSSSSSYKEVPTRSVSVRGVDFVYRQLGPEGDGVPLILLHHLAAVLDNWDPRVIDGLAARRRVITFDNRGVGASGPAGGPGIDKVTALTLQDTLKGFLTRKDPKQFLFFTDTEHGRREARAFLERLKERTDDRDEAISPRSFRAQLKAIRRWGLQPPADLTRIGQPVLVANGESDRLVPSENTLDLAARLPRGELVRLYPDAGHGGIFQYHDEFVARALGFLEGCA